jgi:[acyl-carrier-protein] S-malonyltransferase
MKTAFLFPGQGAQAAGMGMDLYYNNGIYKQTFDMCCNGSGADLKAACFEGWRLDESEIVQPAIFAHSISLLRVLLSEGCDADVYAGLSLGEYTALAAAGVFSVDGCAALVRKRGCIMDNAYPKGEGGMLSVIGFTVNEVEDSIKDFENAYVANHLSEFQTVVAGKTADLLKLKELFEQKGAKMAAMLGVAGPSHAPLLEGAANEFSRVLDAFVLGGMRRTVYSNALGTPYEEGSDIKQLLAKQMCSRVKWHDCVEHMIASGVERFVEIGPGNVLSKLIKRRVEKGVLVESVRDLPTLEKFLSGNKQ